MPDDTVDDDRRRRPFARGTGIVLQVVGFTLFLSSCCVCSSAWLFEDTMSPTALAELLEREPERVTGEGADASAKARQLGVVLLVMFTTIGGLALASFGLGLQSDTPRAAYGAVATSVVMTLVLITACVFLAIGGASVAGLIVNGLLVLLTAALSVMSAFALAEVRRDPPPRDANVLPPDWEPPPRRH